MAHDGGVYVLGGHQTDFARHWGREGRDLFSMFQETLAAGLAAVDLPGSDLDAAHVGNFAAERFCDQGHLGAFFATADPSLDGIPAARHEAACASGSMAILAAMAEIESGRYDRVAVLGLEMMRHVPGMVAAGHIGAPAMWSGRERVGEALPWPAVFSDLGDVYADRYGLSPHHLAEIARIGFANAKRNPRAQTRDWTLSDDAFGEDERANPVVRGRIRRHDCGRITDGAAMVVLASARGAAEWAAARGRSMPPRISGWGHRTSHIGFAEKIAASPGPVFPHLGGAFRDALGRAGVASVHDLDGIEIHDCFTTTGYAILDHLGFAAPGQIGAVLDDGVVSPGGAVPMNPSGGLIGAGHPVGATGVRMLLDCARQVSGTAGDMQVAGASRFGMLNLGGSAATVASFVVA